MDARLAASWEERAQARAEAARRRNEELRQRFLDARVRTMGRDESALAAQIEEKKLRLEQEKEEERRYAAEIQRVQALLESKFLPPC